MTKEQSKRFAESLADSIGCLVFVVLVLISVMLVIGSIVGMIAVIGMIPVLNGIYWICVPIFLAACVVALILFLAFNKAYEIGKRVASPYLLSRRVERAMLKYFARRYKIRFEELDEGD